MSLIKVNLGADLDLEFKKDFPVVAYAFEIENDDCTPYDFTHASAIFFKLYAKRNGKLLATIQMGEDTPSTNVIYLTSQTEITGRRATDYFHVAYAVIGGNNIDLFQGVSSVE